MCDVLLLDAPRSADSERARGYDREVIREDVVIGSDGARPLHADVFEPERSRDLQTAVVQLHGGGFRAGDRKALRPHSERLAAAGFTAVAAEYRLLDEAPYPANLEDARRAVEWAGERFGRVALQGFSAGGLLALLAAGTGSAVGAVIVLYPSVDLSTAHASGYDDAGTGSAAVLLGGGADEDSARAASPLSHVGPSFPPTLLIHGTGDTLVSYRASVRMHEALCNAGVASELHLVAGADHAFDNGPSYADLVAYETVFFLRRTIVEPDAIAAETLTFAEIVARAQPAATVGAR